MTGLGRTSKFPASARGRSMALAGRLFGSSVLAQVAVFGALILAATRVAPRDLALYGMAFSASALLANVNTMAAESRLPAAAAGRCGPLTRAGFSASVVVAALCLLSGPVAAGLGVPVWGEIAWLVAAGSMMIGLHQLLAGWAVRDLRQGVLALNRLVQGLANAVLMVGLVLTPLPGYLALTLAWVASLAAGNVAVAWRMRERLVHFRPARRDDVRTLAGEVRWQPLSNVIVGAAGSLPMLVLPVTASDAVSGAWALANRFYVPLINTTYTTLQPIYYGRASTLWREGRVAELREYHAGWLRRLSAAGVAFLAVVLAGVGWAIPLLGERWEIGAAVVVASCVFYTSQFVCLSPSQTLVLLGRVDLQMVWSLARLAGAAVPFALVGVIGPEAALVSWAVAMAVTFFGQLVLHRRALPPGPIAAAAPGPVTTAPPGRYPT